jgi:hypothetical protein
MAETGQTGIIKEYNEIAEARGLLAPAMLEEFERGKYLPNVRQAYGLVDIYWTYANALYAGKLSPEKFIETVIEKSEELME